MLKFFAFCTFCTSAFAYEILGIFPFGTKSHFVFNEQIMKALAANGHRVTVVSPFRQQKPHTNYTDVDVSHLIKLDAYSVNYEGEIDLNANFASLSILKFYRTFDISWCEGILADPTFRKIYERHFDVIIMEFFNVNCFIPLAETFDAPIIGTIGSRTYPNAENLIGNHLNPSYVPRLMGYVGHEANFYDRLVNVYDALIWHMNEAFFDSAWNEKMFAKHFPNATRPLVELRKKVAMIFYNNHPAILRKSSSPNAIDVAGIHLIPPKALPQDLNEILEESEHGAIFFSLGSMINPKTMPENVARAFMQAFSEIPQTVLWRYSNVYGLEVPKNVHLRNWFPQRDLLAHEKVMAFIGHGGSMSSIEAIDTATPMIGMPFRFDQSSNIRLLEESEAVFHLSTNGITKDKISEALRAVLHDPKYKRGMRTLSAVFRDRPMTARETVSFWTEYVIRHKGAKFLRTKAADMPLYQYLLLDVLAFFLLVLSTLLFVTYRFASVLTGIVTCHLTSKDAKKKIL